MVILLFIVLGFIAGLIYVIKKRGIRLGSLLSTTILGLIIASLYKIFKDNYKNNYHYRNR